MARLKAVLFDFGDTLFHSPSGVAVMVEAGVEEGLAEQLWETMWRSSKTASELARKRDLSADAHRAGWTGIFQPADEHVRGLSSVLYERVMMPHTWIPYPDTLPTLEALAGGGVPVGVISNVTAPLRPVLEAHGLGALVRSCTLSYEHGREKPDPRLFLSACAALGEAPARTLMVGDSHLADGGAVEAGMPVLLLPMVPAGRPRGLEIVLAAVDLRSPGGSG